MSSATEAVPAGPRAERWLEEAAFFDRAARRAGDGALPLDPLAVRRYTRPVPRKRFSVEYRFGILGSLRGKSVLDVGCGEGLNAVMFARLGARVTGIDVSPGALDVAWRRARSNGVERRLSLVCAPIEHAKLPARSFDVVWGDGILHHVLDELELVLAQLARWTKPEGLLVFSEPINLSPTLRSLRRLIPVHTEATPGERPLLRCELDLVRRYVPDLSVRHYSLLGRLDRFVLKNFNYERSSLLRRGIVNALDSFDWALLSLPALQKLAGTCVMYGHPRTMEPASETAGASQPRASASGSGTAAPCAGVTQQAASCLPEP
jgi:2-polyprenyl-3-methyl-5-hydroxy-6-metoxy-1,4-benzoquinol methylase